MPIKYSCFISYRRRSAELAQDFHLSLDRELRHWTSLPIFRDDTEIKGGDFLENKISLALCESACMVMIYTPTYFDMFRTYCAREFKAMEVLEAKRNKMLGARRNEKHGLIIPVVYRGWDYFPKQISDRLSYKFDFNVCGKSYLNRNEYQVSIKEIAQYIYSRCNELNALSKDPCEECSKFEMPSENEVLPWIASMLPQKPILPSRLGRALQV